MEHRVVYLNVGGCKFTCASHTLLEHGPVYFSRLLEASLLPSSSPTAPASQFPSTSHSASSSDRGVGKGSGESGDKETNVARQCFGQILDRDGAVFIDREGVYFGVLLRYMRTGELTIPETISYTTLRQEAEYYTMYGLVDGMNAKLHEAKEVSCHSRELRHDGYYVAGEGAQKVAVAFRARNRLFYSTAGDAEEVMTMFLLTRETPQLWEEQERTTAIAFASFVTERVFRGVYWFDGKHLQLRTAMAIEPNSEKKLWPGLFVNQEIILPLFANAEGVAHGISGVANWAKAPMRKYVFKQLPGMDFRGLLCQQEEEEIELSL